MYIIVFKQHGALHCQTQYFGPYADYMAAEDALCDGTVPLLYGQGGRLWPSEEAAEVLESNGHRFIAELTEATGGVV